MEYRRRKGNSRSSQSSRNRKKQSTSSSSAGRVIVSLLMIAAIVYLVSISAAGTWIAQNVMAPLFSMFDNQGDASPSPTPDSGGDDSQSSLNLGVTGSQSPSVSEDITLPAMNCFLLQMGVYSSESNALSQASELQSQGAGGYIIQDGERYRVMASGYTDEAAARSVKTRLVEEGIDCTVHTIATASATFRVTAPQDQIQGIKTGFRALLAAQESLGEAAIEFDRQNMTVDDGKSAAQSILTALQNDMSALTGYTGNDPILMGVLSAYHNAASSLQELISANYQSVIDFSSKMKYTQLYITHEYVKLMDQLS